MTDIKARFMEFGEALDIVLALARMSAKDEKELLACDVVEDYLVNHEAED